MTENNFPLIGFYQSEGLRAVYMVRALCFHSTSLPFRYSRMNIAIAAWHLQEGNVGIGRYCLGILQGLSKIDRKHQYEILVDKKFQPEKSLSSFTFKSISLPVFKRRVWEQIAPLLGNSYDVLHFPYDSSVKFKKGKFLVTIHDIKPFLFPQLQTSRNLNSLIQRMVVPDRFTQADHIVTSSNHTREDLIQWMGICPDRVSTIYPGIDHDLFRPPSDISSVPRHRPYILTVAGGDVTKNLEALIHAFGLLPLKFRKEMDVLLAGDLRRRKDLTGLIQGLEYGNQIQCTGRVSDQELVRLYQGAFAFVFPSLYEGFGFPVLEAMACGCPVISSNRSSLAEIVEDAGILFDPNDHKELSERIVQLSEDSVLRSNLREKGQAQAARFSWEQTARRLEFIYDGMS